MGVPTDSSTPTKRAGNRTPSTLEQEVATKVKRLRECTDDLFLGNDENEGGRRSRTWGANKSPRSKSSSPSLYSEIVQLSMIQCARTREYIQERVTKPTKNTRYRY